MAEQKETILFDLKIKEDKASVDAMTVSIGSLAEANKKLRAERKELNLTTAEGQKRVQEINKQIDMNNVKIKENSSALEKQRLNVGNYGGALDKLVPGLGATIQGMQGMTKSAMAFIATPIGAVIAALGLILAGLTKFLTGSAEGQDKMNKIMTVASAVVGKFTDLLVDLGAIIFDKLGAAFEFLGNALDKTAKFFGINTDALKAFIQEANDLANLKNFNDELERQLIVQKGVLEAKVAELKLRSEDKSLDLKERQRALKEASAAQAELSALQIQYAENRLKIKQQENAQSASTKEDLKAEAELEAEIFAAKKDAADKQTELFTKEQAIREEIVRGLEAERDAIVALANEENIREGNKVLAAAAAEERHQRELEQINERIQAYVSEEEIMRRRIEALDLEADLEDESAEANADYNKELDKSAKSKAEDARNTAVLMGSLNQLTGVLKQSSIAQKTVASGQALVNTYLGATNVLTAKPPLPFPLNILALTATVASGLSTVAKINGVGFASGGYTGNGYGLADSSGFKPAGIVHEGEWVAPKWMVNKYSDSFMALENQRMRGYASGGFVDFDARQAAGGLNNPQQPQVVPVLVLEDFEYKSNEKNTTLSKARVI